MFILNIPTYTVPYSTVFSFLASKKKKIDSGETIKIGQTKTETSK